MSDYVRGLRAKVGHDLLFWPSVSTLVRDGDRILLVLQAGRRWGFPAGAVDPGETPAEAARREAREEASIEVELVRLLGVFGGYPDFHGFYPNGDEVAWVTSLFEGCILSGTPAPGDDEIAEVRWATVDEALALDLGSSARHMLEAVLAGVTFDS